MLVMVAAMTNSIRDWGHHHTFGIGRRFSSRIGHHWSSSVISCCQQPSWQHKSIALARQQLTYLDETLSPWLLPKSPVSSLCLMSTERWRSLVERSRLPWWISCKSWARRWLLESLEVSSSLGSWYAMNWIFH